MHSLDLSYRNKPIIPDKAVEAAAKQMAVNDGDLISWVLYQADAQRALEAAAPYLMAQAWDEGASVGFSVTREGFNGECAFDHCADDDYPPTNPYSGEKWTDA